jgi:hypothetical protein
MTTLDYGEIPGLAANDDEATCAKLQAKVSDLNDSIHKLRVENLALRTRIERLKSNRSLERKFLVIAGLALWLCFLFGVISKTLLAVI